MKKYLLIIWAIFVFVLLTIPMPISTGDVTDEGYLDKVFHFLMFGIFSYLVINVYRGKVGFIYLIGSLAGVSYAVFGEFVQSFLPSRTVSYYDLTAGVLGVLFFVFYDYFRTKKA